MHLQHLPSAGPLRRIAAMVYDSLLVFAVLFAATLLPALLLNSGPAEAINNEEVVYELHPLLSGAFFQVYLLAVVAGFYCWFWLRDGQTLGMQAWRLQLQDKQGGQLTLKQCLLRFFSAIVSLLVLGLGYWWIWIDKDKLAWHDRWSNTRVVVVPKDKKIQEVGASNPEKTGDTG